MKFSWSIALVKKPINNGEIHAIVDAINNMVLSVFKSQEFEINQGLIACNIRAAQKVDNDKIGISSSLHAATILDRACGSICKHHMKKIC